MEERLTRPYQIVVNGKKVWVWGDTPMERFRNCDQRDWAHHKVSGYRQGWGFLEGDGIEVLLTLKQGQLDTDDNADVPAFIDIRSPKTGQEVSGKILIRYDYCPGEAGAVKIILFVDGVQTKDVNKSADNYSPDKGNRFVLSTLLYPDGALDLKVQMQCSDDKTYGSPSVAVVVKNRRDLD